MGVCVEKHAAVAVLHERCAQGGRTVCVGAGVSGVPQQAPHPIVLDAVLCPSRRACRPPLHTMFLMTIC